MTDQPPRVQEILWFWFGDDTDALAYDETRMDLWFQKGHSYDDLIRERFGTDLARAAAGELDG
jgi:uncharacterized protein (DUF924 family)